MNYWIFSVTSHKSDGRVFEAEEILKQRLSDGFWGLGEKTPNRKNLEKGDEVVFYLGNPVKGFAGSARLGSGSVQLTPSEQEALAHGTNFYRPSYGTWLEATSHWSEVRPVDEILARLGFIENKKFWMTYFQGGIRQIGEEDFRTIRSGLPTGVHPPNIPAQNVESESEFALETHLEEFLDRNWDRVNFGSNLERYTVDEQDGRQFPAGPWSIDFLCLDKDNGDFVVVELKRGKTSDSTVGQILRYLSYVKKHLAKPGQQVRGIIIAREADEALRYAVEPLTNVAVLTYRVDFRLSALASNISE